MEVPGVPQILSSPQRTRSHSFLVVALYLSDSLNLNTGQWGVVKDDLEVCHGVLGQIPARALHCSNGYFGSAPCKENILVYNDLIIHIL